MSKIVLTGHPESGKAELFAKLKQEYSEAYFIEDPVSEIITSQQQENAKINPGILGKLLIARSLSDKQNTPQNTSLIIQHSSLLDVVWYAQENDCLYLLPRLIPLIKAARYTLSLECDPINNVDVQHICTQFKITKQEIPQSNIQDRTTLAIEAINRLEN